MTAAIARISPCSLWTRRCFDHSNLLCHPHSFTKISPRLTRVRAHVMSPARGSPAARPRQRRVSTSARARDTATRRRDARADRRRTTARDGRAVAATSAEASAPPSAPRRDVAADLEADLDSAPSTASLDAHAAATERRRLARRSAALSTDLHRAVARFDAGGWRTDGATAGRTRPRPATIDISTATERRGNAGRCHGPGADGH